MMPESPLSAFPSRSARDYFTLATNQFSQEASRLAQELARRWQNGERVLADELLAQHPELLEQPEAALQVICEEVCVRQQHGQEVSLTDLQRRFPQWRAQVQVLLDCHRLLEAGAAPVFPAAGEQMLGFYLVQVLGQGALGRVYLARQAELVDRLVVLKVAPASSQEHLSLARLQHSYIVPLYQALKDPERNLQVLCMPYLGGTSLDRLLARLRERPLAQRQGSDLVRILDQVEPAGLTPGQGAVRSFLGRASYVEAICWIGAGLAEALQYAHERNLVHLDLKPSNVLLTADGQPMLLDFHLAIKPLQAGEPAPARFGGTPGYMSPEQHQALQALKTQLTAPTAVGPASDIYSLGVLLYECLAGSLPGEAPRPLSRVNPAVSPGLADIVARCLRPNPQERYPNAGELAADLRRHLAHLPLRGVRNRSLVERWRKWRRRRPHALTVAMLAGLALAILAGSAYYHWDRQQQLARQAEQALAEGKELREKGQHAEASRSLARGLEIAQDLPGRADVVTQLRGELELARKAKLRHDLHLLTDQLLFVYDSDSLPPEKLRRLIDACRTLWEARADLGSAAGAEGDHLDLAILWADLLVRWAGNDAARLQALDILAEAEKQFGPNVVLYRERQRHAAALGQTEVAAEAARQAERLAPRTAWEHYALGRALLRSGELADAARHLDQAVALQPQGFWPNFYQGVCAHRQGRHAEAIAAFRACITLAPEKADCYFNRALAYQAQGEIAAALGDYDRAVQLDPTLAAAWLNRGMLHLGEKHLDRAASDFRQALEHGGDPALAHYNLALVCQAQSRLDQALNHVRQALAARPGFVQARELEQRLLMK